MSLRHIYGYLHYIHNALRLIAKNNDPDHYRMMTLHTRIILQSKIFMYIRYSDIKSANT